MILRKTKKGTEDVKLDSEYVYDSNENISQAEFNQDTLSLIPTGEASGNTIYIDDSSNFPVKSFNVKGKTQQNSYAGYQMINLSAMRTGWSASVNVTGTADNINIDRTSANSSLYEINCEENTQYTISGIITCSNLNGGFGIEYKDGTKEAIKSYTENLSNVSFSKTSNAEKQVAGLYIVLYGGATTINLKNLTMAKGTVAKDFEPYVGEKPSPSTDFPQPINNVIGDIKEETINANMLKINRTDSVTTNGVTITPNGDGTFTINGTATAVVSVNLYAADSSSSSIYFKPRKLNLVAGKTYVLHGCPVGGASGNDWKYQLFLSGTGISVQDKGSGATFVPTEATLDSNAYVSIRVASGVTVNNLVFKPMIEEGTTIHSFVPYTNAQVTFPLVAGQKMYEDDYLADDGIHHVKGQIALDGTENWVMNLTSRFYLNIGKKLSSSYGYCNKFSKGNLSDGEFCSFTYNTSNVYIRYDSTTTLADFKSWLAQQYNNNDPVIIEYELAQEVIDPYTEAQQTAWNEIKKTQTYKNITHIITSSDGIAPELEIVYYKDLNVILDNLNNAILSQGANV